MGVPDKTFLNLPRKTETSKANQSIASSTERKYVYRLQEVQAERENQQRQFQAELQLRQQQQADLAN